MCNAEGKFPPLPTTRQAVPEPFPFLSSVTISPPSHSAIAIHCPSHVIAVCRRTQRWAACLVTKRSPACSCPPHCAPASRCRSYCNLSALAASAWPVPRHGTLGVRPEEPPLPPWAEALAGVFVGRSRHCAPDVQQRRSDWQRGCQHPMTSLLCRPSAYGELSRAASRPRAAGPDCLGVCVVCRHRRRRPRPPPPRASGLQRRLDCRPMVHHLSACHPELVKLPWSESFAHGVYPFGPCAFPVRGATMAWFTRSSKSSFVNTSP